MVLGAIAVSPDVNLARILSVLIAVVSFYATISNILLALFLKLPTYPYVWENGKIERIGPDGWIVDAGSLIFAFPLGALFIVLITSNPVLTAMGAISILVLYCESIWGGNERPPSPPREYI